MMSAVLFFSLGESTVKELKQTHNFPSYIHYETKELRVAMYLLLCIKWMVPKKSRLWLRSTQKTIVNERCYRVNIRDFNPILTVLPRYRDLVMYRSMNYCMFGCHT